MRYVIYGAGAVGGTIGARLFEAEREVLLIARGSHHDAIVRDGLCYADPVATRLLPIPVVDHPARVDWREDDIVVLAMKSQGTAEALATLDASASPEVRLLVAQNGVENERLALRIRPDVYGMCVMMPATHLEPGSVVAESHPVVGVLDVGRYPVGSDETATAIARDLTAAGFRSQPDEAIMRWKYEKLLLNLATAVRAMCGPEAGDDDVDAAARARLVEELRAEAVACFDRAGVLLPTPQERSARWGGALTPKAVEGRQRVAGSAWQSLARRTGSVESDFTNGEIVLLGRLHGIATPVNELVRRRSAEVARSHRAPGSVPVQALAADAGLA